MAIPFLFSFAALGLLAGLVALVLLKRLARAGAERRSRGRRARWLTALGTGPVPELRMGEIRALARSAARSRPAQEDLLALIVAERLPPAGERREPFRRALRRAGLQRALRRACAPRSAVQRGRAALIWAGVDPLGAERVIARLTADPDPDVRAAAAQALGACASEEAAWALIEAMRRGHLHPDRCAERL